MFDGEGTRRLLQTLTEGASTAEWERLLARPELELMLPAIGIPHELGVRCLAAVRDTTRREGLDPSGLEIVEYFAQLEEERFGIEALSRDLEAHGDELARAAFERTRVYLPLGCAPGAPRFVLLPLGFDFRADRDTVYVDPLAALRLGYEGIRATLSHELHHVARYRLTGEDLTLMHPDRASEVSGARAVYREWVAWLELEGIADRVSNMTQHPIPELKEAAARRVRQMEEYETLLASALREFALRAAEGPSARWERFREDGRNLAHPIGARVAGRIETELGREALVECVGHPDLFVARYNQVAPNDTRLPSVDVGAT
jgi:hypothetical protein